MPARLLRDRSKGRSILRGHPGLEVREVNSSTMNRLRNSTISTRTNMATPPTMMVTEMGMTRDTINPTMT